ncbi:MAG: hypothetical protein H7X88_01760 [Gloeobacteraceae cyanobacterium ES-bin-316]|nr:hypothetical protein [Ferruginibacter sp.]
MQTINHLGTTFIRTNKFKSKKSLVKFLESIFKNVGEYSFDGEGSKVFTSNGKGWNDYAIWEYNENAAFLSPSILL